MNFWGHRNIRTQIIAFDISKLRTPNKQISTPVLKVKQFPVKESGEVKKSEFSENSETSEKIFPRFSTPSFPFCTIPKTENSEMKTSEFSFKPFNQTPSFSNSEFSVLGIVQNGKLGVGKTRSLVKRLERKLRGFHLRVYRFGYSAKWKTRSWKNSEFGEKA